MSQWKHWSNPGLSSSGGRRSSGWACVYREARDGFHRGMATGERSGEGGGDAGRVVVCERGGGFARRGGTAGAGSAAWGSVGAVGATAGFRRLEGRREGDGEAGQASGGAGGGGDGAALHVLTVAAAERGLRKGEVGEEDDGERGRERRQYKAVMTAALWAGSGTSRAMVRGRRWRAGKGNGIRAQIGDFKLGIFEEKCGFGCWV